MVACGFNPGQDVHPTRVLIVDDNVDMADAMEILLMHAGYDVRVVYNGEEAISVASQFTPDLGIIDIRLPDMNGYELASKLRATASGRLRLIALSGCMAPDHQLATCFDEVTRKPIGGRELQRLLRRLEPR